MVELVVDRTTTVELNLGFRFFLFFEGKYVVVVVESIQPAEPAFNDLIVFY